MKDMFIEIERQLCVYNYPCVLVDNETKEVYAVEDDTLKYPYYDRELAVNHVFKNLQDLLFCEADFSIDEVEKQIVNERYLVFFNSKYAFDIIEKADQIDEFFTDNWNFFKKNGFCFDEAIEKTEFTAKLILSCANDFFNIDTEG